MINDGKSSSIWGGSFLTYFSDRDFLMLDSMIQHVEHDEWPINYSP